MEIEVQLHTFLTTFICIEKIRTDAYAYVAGRKFVISRFNGEIKGVQEKEMGERGLFRDSGEKEIRPIRDGRQL